MDGALRITLVEFTPSGGLFHFAVQLAEAMAALGHRVDLVCGTQPELEPRVLGVTLSPILTSWHPAEQRVPPPLVRKLRRAGRGLRYLAAYRRLADHLARHPTDVVQWADWRFAVDGVLVSRLVRRQSRCVMADVAHTPRPYADGAPSRSRYKQGPLVRRALGKAYRAMAVIFVLGEQSRLELEAAWPGLARVEVIPHGDETIFVPEGVPTPDACPPRALFFGSWSEHKGLDVLLDAFALVRRSLPTAELVVAGPVAVGVDVGALSRRAAAIGGIDLRPGYVPVSEVRDLFGAARLVVAPYTVANQSGVVHVAHTFGRPMVASDVGDLPDAVRQGETGLLVPPRDVKALAAALERLLGDADEAGRLGQFARRRLDESASWTVVAERMTAVYADLVSRRQPDGMRRRERQRPSH